VSDGVRIDYRVCEGDSIQSLAFVQSDGDQNPFGSGDPNVFVFTSDDITTLQSNGFVVLGLDRMEPGVEVGEIWFLGVYTAEVGEIFSRDFSLAFGDDRVRVYGRTVTRVEFDQQARNSLAMCG
jgi:hypothetical protein